MPTYNVGVTETATPGDLPAATATYGENVIDFASAASFDGIAIFGSESSSANATDAATVEKGYDCAESASATESLALSAVKVDSVTSDAIASDAASPELTANESSSASSTQTATVTRELNLAESATAAETWAPSKLATETYADALVATSVDAVAFGLNIVESAIASSAASLARTLNLAESATASETWAPSAARAADLESTASATDAITQTLTATTSVTSNGSGRSYASYVDPNQTLAWANSETMAAALWRGMTFNSLAVIGGQLVGAADDGLHLLQGDDDAGTPIAAEVVTDRGLWGNRQRKRFYGAYITATAAGPLRVSVETEDGSFDYDTELPEATYAQNQLAEFGRALEGVVASFTLSNPNGVAFDVQGVELALYETGRRIQ